MNNTAPSWIIVNDTFHRQDELLLPVGSRAVRYGDGCFETLRSYRGKFLKLDAHLERLEGALDYLRIQPPFELDKELLREKILNLLDRNSFSDKDAVVRIQVWREGERGFTVSQEADSGYCITASRPPDITDSVTLATVATRRIPSESLNPRFKLSNSINYIQAATEAAEQDADDALMQTIDGHVSETTIANLFWMDKNAVYTPSVECEILPGITRAMLLDLLENEFDVDVIEGQFALKELLNAEAAWICNSVRELVPVQSVDDHTFTVPHPFIIDLKEGFKSYKKTRLR